jgi:prepilin-type N-terminal cleavage/methylation domain-containing protein
MHALAHHRLEIRAATVRERWGDSRYAFTLVELLVVIAIIVVLAGIVIMFLPSITAQTSESQGAVNFQGWLNIARQQAIRNQNPYGVRLWVKNLTAPSGLFNFWTSDCNYIEQPTDFVGPAAASTVVNVPAPVQLPTATITVASTQNFPPATPANPITIYINVGTDNTPTQVTYTGTTPTSFTGCVGGAGTLTGSPNNTVVWWASQLSAAAVPNQTPPIWQPQFVTIVGADLTGGYGVNIKNQTDWNTYAPLFPVQPGDLLEVNGGGLLHMIAQPVSNPAAPVLAQPIRCTYDAAGNPTSFLIVNTPFQTAISSTTNYRIIRAPRVVGDETLALPEGVVVDLNTNLNKDPFNVDAMNNPQSYWNPTFQNAVPLTPTGVAGYVDVLFGPSGALLSPTTQTTMNFWIRLPDQNQPANVGNVYSGTPTIIAVHQGTGLVAAYAVISGVYPPPAQPSPNPNPYADIH